MQHQAPESSDRARRDRSLQRPHAWLLRRLDSLLSDSLRQASPAELTRARVLAGIISVMLPFLALFLISLRLASRPWPWFLPSAVGLLGLLGTLVLLRRATSASAASLLMCMTTLAGVMLSIAVFRDPHVSAHAAVVLAPALTVYLLGPRLGLIAAALTLASTWTSAALLYTGLELAEQEHLWLMNVSAAMCTLTVWALGWLHSTARDEARAALEQALRKLGASERKLSSLFENTGDMACSLDAGGRLVLANAAMRRSYAGRFGEEPVVGEPLLGGATARERQLWEQKLGEALAGRRSHLEVEYEQDDGRHVIESAIGPILGEDGQVVGVVMFGRDITDRKQAELELRRMHHTLIDVSRQAGMAEIATGLFHNVGNALNSVHVSASLLGDGLRTLRIPSLMRVVDLLDAHAGDLGAFVTDDERGRQVPAYLRALAEQLGTQQASLIQEMRALDQSVEHIGAIIRTQQEHARAVEAVEEVWVPELIDEALRLHAVSFERLAIAIERDYGETPSIVVDRHKLLQILVNLLSNARHALTERDTPDKRLGIRIELAPDGAHLRIAIADNGVGIASENLERVFHQGFTTKKTGHGFGLHISALSATEMKGRLSCASPGLGHGATFTIELPLTDHAQRQANSGCS